MQQFLVLYGRSIRVGLNTGKRKYRIDFVMSLNISAIQYKRDEFEGDLLTLLDEYGISHEQIELEITESVLIDDFKMVLPSINTARSKLPLMR